jgi:GTPase SAR1 family protein
MVGNKIDLEDERKISTKEAQELANSFQMQYFEASAKENKGINEFFETLMT